MNTITLSNLAALLSTVLSTAAFVISLMNYLRDKPRVKVFLKWDMEPVADGSHKMGIVRVTNVGRRPIYISVVALKVPRGFKILKESMSGRKLSEGDAPATFSVNYTDAGLAQHSKHWRKVRGYVEDSASGKYLSKKLRKSEIPSWAK